MSGFDPPSESDVIAWLVTWAAAHPTIQTLLLTGSRARPGGPVDSLSDYDLIVVANDADRMAADDSWQFGYGEPLVRWGDDSEEFGLPTSYRGVIYRDGVQIDYTLWPAALLARVADADSLPLNLDEGYRVLFDRDGATARWKSPTHRAYIPDRPTQAVFDAVVEEFWWSATYVAKALWRDELMLARWVLDQDIKNGPLRRLLEWRMEMDHDWSVRPGVLGRGLKRLLPPELWDALEATYVGPGIDDNWDALFATIALSRRVGLEIASALDLTYLHALDNRVSAKLETIRSWPPLWSDRSVGQRPDAAAGTL